ncbi:TetR/AcrR family transcriptional regulator [Aquirufa sp. ROCK-SH2]
MNKKHDKEEVVRLGLALFCKVGYSALGIDEICKKTGMTKGAFYNAFKSKELFLLETINYYSKKNVERIIEQLKEKKGELAIERLKKFYHVMFEAQPKNEFTGCYINNIMAELSVSNPQIALSTAQEFDQFLDVIEPCVLKAQAEGSLTRNINSRALTELIHSTFYGLLTRVKSTKDYQSSIQSINILFNQLK